MPELPEVETVRRGLAPAWEGRIIRRCDVRTGSLRWPLPPNLDRELAGRRIIEVARRNKHLLIRLEDGRTWMVHLGMTGRWTVHPPGTSFSEESLGEPGSGTGPHDHVSIELNDGAASVFTDPRRFGSMDLVETTGENHHPHLARLGPEPTDPGFDGALICDRLRDRRAPLKSALLDQTTIAGLGNIYVCEALHRSSLSPRRKAGSIVPKRLGMVSARAELLATSIVEVIAEAIESGGSTLRDFSAVDGSLGYFAHRFAVYDREGEHCPKSNCVGTIQRFVQSGRSTFHCPTCQR